SNHDLRTAFGRVDWQRDGETVIEDGYNTQLIADEAIRVITSSDEDQPFFLYVAFHAPHSPLQAPAEAIAKYAHIEDENRRVYAAMVTEMDAAVGRVTDALGEAGILEETLVMFFTDNGGVPHLGASNAPFRGGKNSPWEGGLRVPAVAYWSGVLDAGTVFNNRVTVMDLLPTFMDMADLPLDPPRPLAGYNLWPALSEGVPTRTGEAVFSNYVGGNLLHAYFKDEWKLVRGRNDEGEVQDFLFDIFVDPYEQNDVAEDYPDIFARLVEELDAMPKAEPLTRGEIVPDFNAPGAPASIEPDTRPVIATPFAESGPIPYPTENYSAE
ncbi:MAG: sulfatase family protein, partial [Gammaproteobacteria bacterium]